ncbi:MAG: hypothetical protein PHX83_06645 [Acidobacteriia bacterium]|nr:hypothetical protein [Terriglobia bacterium]
MTTLFEKCNGRYHPVRDTAACDGLGIGSHVVTVMKEPDGCTLTSYRGDIIPAFASVLAAIPFAREAMLSAMVAANRIERPMHRQMTAKQKRAWAAYQAVMAEDADVPMCFEGVSMHDVVDAGIKALEAQMGVEK